MNSSLGLLFILQFLALCVLSYRLGNVEKRLATALGLLRDIQPKPEPKAEEPEAIPVDQEAETCVMTHEKLKAFAAGATITPTLPSAGSVR